MVQMTRAQFRRGLEDGLNAHFGRTYRRYKTEWTEIYETATSRKAYEEQVLQEMLGAAQVKAEGDAVAYDSGREVWSVRYVHRTYALAFAITEEAIDDNLYGELGAQYSKSLALSLQHTKEIEGVSVLNNGFQSSGYDGGDGEPLFSTAHPLSAGGTFANKLDTPADLSEESLEDLCILIEGFTDERGIPMSTMPVKLIVPRQLRFTAQKIMQTQYTPFSNENTKNVVRTMFSQEPSVNHRLTDPKAFFILTDCEYGLQHFNRRAVRRGVEGDFETGNQRYKGSERYINGWSNPRGAAASEGAPT